MSLELEAIDVWLDTRLRLDATLQALMGQRWYAGAIEEQEPGSFAVRLLGMPAGGSFTLSLGAETTAPIAYNATAATVKAALEALATPVPGDILVEGFTGGPWIVSLTGLLGSSVSNLTANGSSLTGGSSPSVDVDPSAPIYPLGTYHTQTSVDRIGNDGSLIMTEAQVMVKVYGERGGFLALSPIVKRINALLYMTAPQTVSVSGDSYVVRGSHRIRPMRLDEAEQGIIYRCSAGLYRVFVHPS